MVMSGTRTAVYRGTSTSDGIIRNPQIDFSTIEPGAWDGRDLPYLPRIDLDIDPALKLNTEFELEIDPITYQVLRSRFWNMNLDHSDTIKRVSGSANIVYMDDFNTSLLTENGDTIVCGPSVQYFTGHGDLAVKWTLEHRSTNPGIEDGDVFLQNDPYIGTEHQMDTMTYLPIFWDGGLFCWILSNTHVGDVGGTDAGSFCIGAQDIFSESAPVPPIKIVRQGALQNDVVEMFVRKSRTPDQVALQLRSQLAGLRLTRERIHEMLREFGPRVVKGAMRRMIKDCSESVSRRLTQIPDGEWTEVLYIGSAGPDDRDVHRVVTSVQKKGDRLIFTNAGSDAQFYAANAPFSAWRSSLMCAGAALFGYDQYNCPAGVADHMEFRPVAGTLTCARYPAAVSTLTASIVTVYLASQVMSKMVLAGPPEVRRVANASGGVSLPGWWVAAGLDRNGRFVADLTGDSLNGSIGAFPNRDGVDTGGAWWWPNSNAGNLEEWESAMPILYLFRREQLDSGGAGKWRGGNGLEIAILPHKTDEMLTQIVSSDPAINTSPGLAGGMPGHPGNFLMTGDSGVRALFAAGSMPSSRAELENAIGNLTRMSPKSATTLKPDDVFCVEYSGGGGYGDPLHRDPARVLVDVEQGRVSVDHARTQHGVVIVDGVLDAQATDDCRGERRTERLAAARAPRTSHQGAVNPATVRLVAESFGVSFAGDAPVWACSDCGQRLGPVAENYKDGAAIAEVSPYDIDPIAYPNPLDFCDVPFVLRNFLCPSCGVYLATECCREDDDLLHDIAFSDAGLQMLAG
jgi:N-methylhydantoinase B